MQLQLYLRNGGTPEELLSKYAIKSVKHGRFPNLVLFKYNQIDSPFAERIVQESRGVILDSADGWSVVSRAFDKFFNWGEGHAAAIGWSTARVQEKLDGSLCVLYHYAGGWHVATSGTPDAGGDVNGMGFTFAELFWQTFDLLKLQLPTDTDYCYTFELTTPYNRVVVPHKEKSLTLLAVRNRVTGLEHPVEAFASAFPIVDSFPLQSLDDVQATFKTMNPLEQEGYVIVDENFARIKVKHPGYVAIHGLRDGFGPRRLMEIIRTNEQSELLTYYPEWTEDFRKIETRFDSLVSDLTAEYEAIKGIEVQKDFAMRAVKSKCSGALFSYRAGKVPSIRQFLAEMNIKSLMSIVGVRDVEVADAA